MSVNTYDPNELDIILGGIRAEGFGEGAMVSIAYTTPRYSSVVGTDGKVTRVRSADRRATITITLSQTSEVNDRFSDLLNGDTAAGNGSGVVDLRIADKQGTSLYEDDKVWIQGDPGVTFSNGHENREWVIECADLRSFHGSNPDN